MWIYNDIHSHACNMHSRQHAFTYTQTCVHVQHAFTSTCVPANMRSRKHAFTQTCVHDDMRSRRHAFTTTCVHANMRSCKHAFTFNMRSCQHAFTPTSVDVQHALMFNMLWRSTCVHVQHTFNMARSDICPIGFRFFFLYFQVAWYSVRFYFIFSMNLFVYYLYSLRNLK